MTTPSDPGARDSTGHYHGVLEEIGVPYRQLRELVPDVTAGFAAMQRAAMADGVLSGREKELIALAIAITRECDGCIAAHARGAVRRGVPRAQIAEMIGVVILMNGGPGTVFGPRALAAYDEFAVTAADGAAPPAAPAAGPPPAAPAPGA